MFEKINEAKKLLDKNSRAALELLSAEEKEYEKFLNVVREFSGNLDEFQNRLGHARALTKDPKSLAGMLPVDKKQVERTIYGDLEDALVSLNYAKSGLDKLKKEIEKL